MNKSKRNSKSTSNSTNYVKVRKSRIKQLRRSISKARSFCGKALYVAKSFVDFMSSSNTDSQQPYYDLTKNESKRSAKRHGGRCNGDCANCPPHYGYRYGRWYYGHSHTEGCEFGGNSGSGGRD